MSTSNYAYASGKLRALETKILSNTDIERMVDAPDHTSAFKVLNDTDYADNLLEVEPNEYRTALHDDYRQLFNFFKQLIPDNKLLTLIFLDRDFVNLKLLFKAKYFNLEINELLNKNTIYSTEALQDYIFEGKNGRLPKEIKLVIDNVNSKLSEKSGPEVIDSLLAKEYFGLMKETAKKVKSKLINDYVDILINNANLITFLRAKRLGLELKNLEEILITDSKLKIKELTNFYGEETKKIRNIIIDNYDSKVVTSFDEYCEKNLLFDFERSLEDYKTRHIRQANQIAYGPEVVIAYYVSKLNAITNIRIIMTGKLNNIPAEAIKQTLRSVF